MTGGQIDKQSWHDWNKKHSLWCIFLSLNLIVISDAAPNPHSVTGAPASALPGNSSSSTSTSSSCPSPSSSHSSSLPSYASHDRGAAVRRQGNKNISGNIFHNKICVTPAGKRGRFLLQCSILFTQDTLGMTLAGVSEINYVDISEVATVFCQRQNIHDL